MKAILVLTATLAFVLAPFVNTGFNGFDPDQYPIPQDNPPVQPAGYAFSIWGVIYLWLLVSAVFGLFRRADDAEWDGCRWPLFVSLAVGAGWLAVAQSSPVLATVLIWVMLISAIMAMVRAPAQDPWLARYPVELHTGWLTAASCVSIGLLGAGYGIGFAEQGWAYVGLGLCLLIALMVQFKFGPAPLYILAVIWALVAVVVKNGTEVIGVSVAALLAIAVLLAVSVPPLLRDVKAKRQVQASSSTHTGT
jgi:uncharacterized membrane protein YhaH (DUF805 family)